MMRRNLEDHEWDTLIGKIKRGNCILMLGPDASLEKVKVRMNGEEKEVSRPLKEILANELAERIKADDREGKIKPGLDQSKFGFEQWYLRVLLHVLRGDKKEAYSFALEQFPTIVKENEFQQTILNNKSRKQDEFSPQGTLEKQ